MSPILQVDHLFKRFGGLAATNDCNLEIAAGEVHALIGPNGAGKTTLLAQLSGELASDSGRILFRGNDVTRQRVHQRVAAGIARSYQITTLFARLTVRENLALAAQEIAHVVGLSDALNRVVGTLSHGKQRALELGMALACQPAVLLLDEPMAGTDPEESQRMADLIQALRGTYTIVLVEHDMDAVFRLADRISVLVAGHVIATGAPADIRANPAVIQAYLGNDSDTADEASATHTIVI